MAAMVVSQSVVKNWEKSGKDDVYVRRLLLKSISTLPDLYEYLVYLQFSAV